VYDAPHSLCGRLSEHLVYDAPHSLCGRLSERLVYDAPHSLCGRLLALMQVAYNLLNAGTQMLHQSFVEYHQRHIWCPAYVFHTS